MNNNNDTVKILIIEDDVKWHKIYLRDCPLIKEIYIKNPNSILFAVDYKEALDKMTKNTFSLAITDFLLDNDEISRSEFPWRNLARVMQENKIPNIVVSGTINSINLLSEMINEYNIAGFFSKNKLDLVKLSNFIKKILSENNKKEELPAKVEMKESKYKKLTLLHISDLHCGKKHRFTKHNEYVKPSPDADIPELDELISKDVESLNKKIDYLIISGDLTESAHINEFSWARKLITSLAKKLDVDLENIVVVPGNHDVLWFDEDENNNNYPQDPNGSYLSFYENFYKCLPHHERKMYHVVYHPKNNIAIIGLDTSIYEGKNTSGIGCVGHGQRDDALNQMYRIAGIENKYLKIAVLHHHLIPVEPELTMPNKDNNFSLIMDSSLLLRELYKDGFSIVLHGHKHQPFYSDIRLYEYSRRSSMAIIGSGSSGIKRDELGNIGKNHYNIIEVNSSEKNNYLTVYGRATSDFGDYRFGKYQEFEIDLGNNCRG